MANAGKEGCRDADRSTDPCGFIGSSHHSRPGPLIKVQLSLVSLERIFWPHTRTQSEALPERRLPL